MKLAVLLAVSQHFHEKFIVRKIVEDDHEAKGRIAAIRRMWSKADTDLSRSDCLIIVLNQRQCQKLLTWAESEKGLFKILFPDENKLNSV